MCAVQPPCFTESTTQFGLVFALVFAAKLSFVDKFSYFFFFPLRIDFHRLLTAATQLILSPLIRSLAGWNRKSFGESFSFFQLRRRTWRSRKLTRKLCNFAFGIKKKFVKTATGSVGFNLLWQLNWLFSRQWRPIPKDGFPFQRIFENLAFVCFLSATSR